MGSGMQSSSVDICSVDELKIELPDDIRAFLGQQYADTDGAIVSSLFAAMKRPPVTTACRVNQILSTREQLEISLQEFLLPYPHLRLKRHDVLTDVLCIVPREPSSCMLYTYRNPLSSTNNELEFEDASTRKAHGWPMTHRVILCDRFCGEAVLRGSDVFVRGILVADPGIHQGETVAVYADISAPNDTSTTRGSRLDLYQGRCLFLGLGTVACPRAEFFRSSHGVGIVMSNDPQHRVGPCPPPLFGVLQDKMMLQNLPSALVGHILNPQPGEIILDMCAAPGGKSAHLASLTRNRATILSCDKSRRKMVTARDLFLRLGATCITPLALDTTKCTSPEMSGSIEKLLAESQEDEQDKLRNITRFPTESFDRILLDPPCSALGLRPKLFIPHTSLRQLQKHAEYQRNFIKEAVALLKPGGYLTYSTCTINAEENEAMVHHILMEYPSMSLIAIPVEMGQQGLPGFGLDDEGRGRVRRFDPHNAQEDSMGFFVALLRKQRSHM